MCILIENVPLYVFLDQIKEMVQEDPFLPLIEIVEKCRGPQTHSHVFVFRSGV